MPILGSAARGPAVLTRREREIAELVGHHLTNREIAANSDSPSEPSTLTSATFCGSWGRDAALKYLYWAAHHGLLPPYARQRGPRM